LFIKNNFQSQSFDQLKQLAKEHLEAEGFVVDYVEIADRSNLAPAKKADEPLVALIAASIGKIRLIDNLILN
jgi:pantoate--beta-alanine ligase